MHHFFAYLSRMKFIQRWGLMRNTRSENIQEHSLEVAMIAHALAIIKNRFFRGQVDPERVMALAVFHEVSEVITGDLATPIKYFNPEIENAYHKIEKVAKKKLINMLPRDLQDDYENLLFVQQEDWQNWRLVKAADKISAYLKCVEELKGGNQEFSKALKTIKVELDRLDLPEAAYFMKHFLPSYSLTLDELN
ncbi:5'-deoxynucleotidase [Dehalobacterium formicoaceticum]|uniref:5'-deoxynucleotidase n=1 Tax=Dehalobacterium formicoaceticum TaxID=51515 RepID=A0ABT1Y5L7_9FIRM|nr:5'-deoxynucleotidase [Dehalobacterium formicoaceticum]MCR6546184.1 5'-deoxynucleotidase [Dehalobacterium formicoaceticum]